jgi:hypothetical protein
MVKRSLLKHLYEIKSAALAMSRIRINIRYFVCRGLYQLLVITVEIWFYGSLFFLHNFSYVAFWSTISKRLRWSKNHCYLFYTGSNGRVLVELEYKKTSNYIDK